MRNYNPILLPTVNVWLKLRIIVFLGWRALMFGRAWILVQSEDFVKAVVQIGYSDP